jgi:hypothetical protein
MQDTFIDNFNNFAIALWNRQKTQPYSDQIKKIDNVVYIRGIVIKIFLGRVKRKKEGLEYCEKFFDWINSLSKEELLYFHFLKRQYLEGKKIIDWKTYKKEFK